MRELILSGLERTTTVLFALYFLMLSSPASGLQAEWMKLAAAKRVTPRRSGHVAFHDNKIPYVFGGYVEEDNKDGSYRRYVVNDLWKFRDTWTLVPATGDLPGPRLVSAMALSSNNKKAYLFGGWDPQTEGTGGVILDDVHELSTDTGNDEDATFCVWKKLEVTMPDGPTSRHVTVSLKDNRILVHTHRCDGHVYLFDPVSQAFEKQVTSGECPSSRGLHAATRVNDSTVYFFGGAGQDQTMSNESFLLNTETWEWTKILHPSADCPSPRASPCVVCLSETSVLLFGGAEATATGLNPCADVWALSLETSEWTRLLRDDVGPPPRNAATLTEIELDDDSSSNEGTTSKGFLLTGGWAPFRETWDDSFVLRVTP